MEGYAEPQTDGALRCGVCPHRCRLIEGGRGLCGVRERRGDGIRLVVMDRPIGLAVDPVEKKPLHHFLPGAGVLSFGTIGCNLTCGWCQNHPISRARDEDVCGLVATPATIAATATAHGCAAVAFTYNDPAVWPEYAIATAQACRAGDLATIAVSAGYMQGRARSDLFAVMDAANIDLKAFNDATYRIHCGAHLAPVLDTLRWLKHETPVWLEVTTLLIPGINDGDAELRAQFRWMADELGITVPLHLSAFHPDHRLRDIPPTPPATLRRARDLALEAGLRFVYAGNVRERWGGDTTCPGCGTVVIARDGWRIEAWRMHAGACSTCGAVIPGRFPAQPGGWRGAPRSVRLQARSM